MTTKPITRIAIIGAGAAGLTQLKQLLDAFSRPEIKTTLQVTCYESRDQVGGTWIMHPHVKPPLRTTIPHKSTENGKDVEQMYFYPMKGEDPSPIYEGLRTNLPHDLMSFRGVPFPEGTPLFPDQSTVLQYLQNYAKNNNLIQHIQFHTRVERIYLTPLTPNTKPNRRWTVETSNKAGRGERKIEEFDYISITNGHYTDSWIPEIEGLNTFPGKIIHSRYYRRPSDYTSQTVMVVGSYASGSDIARQLGGLNLGKFSSSTSITFNTGLYTPADSNPSTPNSSEGYTKIYQSSSGAPNPHALKSNEEQQPWREFIEDVPLISHVEPPSPDHPKGRIHFKPSPWSEDGETHEPIDDVDVIIFATGYNFAYPFFKINDAPWNEKRLLESVIQTGERAGGEISEEGGLKGLGVKGLDELLLFLDGDRSIAFPALAYQVVPFPLSECQTRLISLLWANLLPSFPAHPTLPPNPSNPYFTPSSTPPTSISATTLIPDEPSLVTKDPAPKPSRQVLITRQKLVFGAPFEWLYSEYLMSLMKEADEGKEVEQFWKRIEDFRKERRADTGLRRRTLGY